MVLIVRVVAYTNDYTDDYTDVEEDFVDPMPCWDWEMVDPPEFDEVIEIVAMSVERMHRLV